MTIASQTSRISYNGDGSTTAFSVPFFFSANSDIAVTTQVTATGVISARALGTDYTLTGATVPAGGTCTFLVAPPAGTLVTILRDPPITQTASYNNNDPFPAKSHEGALDKATTIDQRTRDIANRSIRAPDGDVTLDMTLPTAQDRKSLALGFDRFGKPALLNPSSAVTSALNVTFLQAGTGAIGRSSQDKARETISIMDFGAVGDGATDDAAAFQAACNYIGTLANGGTLNFPAKTFALGTTITPPNNISFQGAAGTPIWGAGTQFKNISATTNPVFKWQATLSLAAYGVSFKNIVFEGQSKNAPMVSCLGPVTADPTIFGSFGFQFDQCRFYNCRPAIYAEFAFDWWISRSQFIRCGNAATGSGKERASIYTIGNELAFNALSNSWHITDNFIDTTTGYGFMSDAVTNGAGYIFFTNNHCEADVFAGGYAAVYSTPGLVSSYIAGNFMGGTGLNQANVVIGASGSNNRIIGNLFRLAGLNLSSGTVAYYHIVSSANGDTIMGNNFEGANGATAYINLLAASAKCRVIGNNTVWSSVLTLDAGTGNLVQLNGGTDNPYWANMKPTDALAWTDGTNTHKRSSYVGSLANNGILPLTTFGTNPIGKLTVIAANNGNTGEFHLRGSVHATVEASDPGATYSITSGTASSVNVYWSGTRYELENKLGSTLFFSATYEVI